MTPTWIRRLFARCPSPFTRRPAKWRLSLEALEGRLVPTSSTVSLLSAAADGSAGGATSLPGNTSPVVSQDGRYVVFQSAATDLVAGQSDANSTYDVFLRDRQTGTTTLVSRAAGSSTQTANGQSVDGSISADGRYVTYRSVASNLVSGQTDLTNYDVFLFDSQTGSTTLVSHTPASSTTASNGFSSAQRLSADGNFVVYTSTSTNILPNQATIDLNGTSDVFLYDRANDTTYLVSVSTTGTTGSGASDQPTLSADGRYVVFRSSSTNLVSGVTDTNGNTDVFLYDRLTGSRTLISHNGSSSTAVALGQSQTPVISADGNYVAFVSYANNLVPGESDTNLSTDAFLYARGTGEIALVSHVAGDPLTAGESFADQVSISADGRYVAYVSASTDVVAGQLDNNFDSDVFVYDSQTGESRLVSHFYGDATTAADAFSSTPTISLDGRYVAYVSVADDLVSGQDDANGNYDVFLYDSQTGLNVLLSHVGGDDLVSSSMGASQAQISGDGSVVIFASSSPDLVSGDDNSATDMFAGSAGSPNTAPTASIVTIGAVRQEGTSIAVSGSGSDAEQTAGTLGLSWAVFKNGSATAFATGTGAGWSFTPDDDGSYRIALTVTDNGGLTASAEQTIAVSNVAPAPSIVSIGAVRVEGTSIAVSGSATDAAGANDTLSYSWAVYQNGGVTPFATGTGTSYSFTPGDDGSYRIVLTVSDEDGGSASAEQTISVSNVAPTPSIVSVGAVRVEGTSIAVSGTATDPAGANDTLSYAWQVFKDGAVTPFATGTGSGFSFTPGDDGSYRIVLTVSDEDGGSASAEQTVTVSNVAPTPSIVSIGAVRVEGTSIAVSGTASDPAGVNDTLSYTWQVFKDGSPTPFATGAGSDYSFAPDDDGSYRIVLTVSDEDGGSNSAEQTIGVNNAAPTPSIVSIGAVRVEGTSIAVSGSATDAAGLNDTLSHSWEVFKDGGVTPFATGTGSDFSFAPDDDGSYRIVLTVSDEDGGSASAEQTIAVSNVAPAPSIVSIGAVRVEGTSIAVSGSATDAAGANDTLSYSWAVYQNGGVTPFATGTGTSYSFTPGDDGSYRIVLTVSDEDGGSNSAEQTITASNVAPTPSIVSIGAVRVEGTSIAVSGTASDPAGVNDTLSYTWQVFKDGSPTPFATGAGSDYSFAPDDDGSYRIVLTVSDEDGGSNSAEQTIGVSNRSPLLVSLPGGAITEGAAYTFTVTSEDVPADGLTYALEGDVPAGAAIDPVTGVFTWTPTDAQGPGTYTFTVRVTDDGTPGLSDARSVTFDVAEANEPPTLTGVPARATLFEGQAYQFTALAADADLPATTLQFSLIGGPAGAAIDPVTGVFTWTPAADQGASSYSFAVRVSDGSATADLAVELDVRDVKTAPVSGPTGVTVVAPGESGRPLVRVLDPLTGEERFTVTAYDPSFTGGVRVASGDVNHDGVLDLVTAPGVSGAAHIRVFDGSTGAAAASFFAYARDFTGGAYVAAGDLDGDGVAEIVTGAGVGGAPHVKVFRMDGTELASFFAYDPTVRGGVTVAVADVDGDGRAEIVTGPGPGGGPHVKVFRADGAAAGGFLAYAPEFRGGVFVAAGDLDGDGAAEIITGAGAGGGAHVRVFDGRTHAERFGFAAGASGFAGGVRVGLTRVAPDGRAAIVTTLGPGDRPQVRIWSGADGSELTGFLAEDPGFAGGIYVAG
jgi:PKD repeat protein